MVYLAFYLSMEVIEKKTKNNPYLKCPQRRLYSAWKIADICLRSIGTLCPQVYASWKFFLCGRPQYFHIQVAVVRREVRGSLRTSVRSSADVYADVRMDWCGHPHGLVRTSAWMGVDVCGSPHGWVRTSAGPEDLLELLPLLCNNLLIICAIT